MARGLELFDLADGNLVGSYQSLEDALSIVRRAYDAHGWGGIQDLGLIQIEEDGSERLVAADRELAYLAIGEQIATWSA